MPNLSSLLTIFSMAAISLLHILDPGNYTAGFVAQHYILGWHRD